MMTDTDLKSTYNTIAEDWHRDHQADDWWVEGTEKFIKLLREGALVLDVGCGGGVKSRFLKDRGLEVVGIDFAEKMVEISRRENPDCEFEVADMRDLSKYRGRFDGVFAQASLLHIPKKIAGNVVRELAQVLKPNGYLYVAVKSKREGSPEEENKTESDYGYDYIRFFSYFSVDELSKYCTEAGLHVIHTQEESAQSHWLQIIAQKL